MTADTRRKPRRAQRSHRPGQQAPRPEQVRLQPQALITRIRNRRSLGVGRHISRHVTMIDDSTVLPPQVSMARQHRARSGHFIRSKPCGRSACDGEVRSCGWPTAVLLLVRVTDVPNDRRTPRPLSRPDVSVHGEASAVMGGRALPPVARCESVRLTTHRRRSGVRADRSPPRFPAPGRPPERAKPPVDPLVEQGGVTAGTWEGYTPAEAG
jgi:hypothetical protein